MALMDTSLTDAIIQLCWPGDHQRQRWSTVPRTLICASARPDGPIYPRFYRTPYEMAASPPALKAWRLSRAPESFSIPRSVLSMILINFALKTINKSRQQNNFN